jgi:hypothetical protein
MPATTEAIRATIADFLNAERIATQATLDAAGGSIRVCSYVRARVANCPADNMALYNEVKEVLRALLPAE